MAEIIEIPVENNTGVSEYTPQQVGGILGGIVGGLIKAEVFKSKKRENLNIKSLNFKTLKICCEGFYIFITL